MDFDDNMFSRTVLILMIVAMAFIAYLEVRAGGH